MSKLLLAISASILALATAAEADHKRWHCQWKPEHARWGTSPCERGGGNARSVSPSQQGKRGGSDNGVSNGPDTSGGGNGNSCSGGGNCGVGLGNGGGNGTGNEGGGTGPGDNGNQPDENPGRGTGRGRDD